MNLNCNCIICKQDFCGRFNLLHAVTKHKYSFLSLTLIYFVFAIKTLIKDYCVVSILVTFQISQFAKPNFALLWLDKFALNKLNSTVVITYI